MLSGGLLRKARPNPNARRIGKPSDQKIASGSRMNSLTRTAVSCQSDDARRPSLIAQLPSGQRDEHVLQCRRVGSQLGELEAMRRDEHEQCGNDAVQLLDLKLVFTSKPADRPHARNRA